MPHVRPQRLIARRRVSAAWNPCVLAATTAFLIGCGSDAQADDASADSSMESAVSANAMAESAAVPAGRDESQDTVTYNAGDIYEDSGFKTTYLGMAKLPLGNGNVFDDGSCVTVLFEATYLETPGSSNAFRPAVKGYFTDGREAGTDETGVGCDTKGIRALGYEFSPRRRFTKGETARLYAGAVHIPAADEGKLAYVTLFGSVFTRMAVKIVETP
jgi:hypothetical protein